MFAEQTLETAALFPCKLCRLCDVAFTALQHCRKISTLTLAHRVILRRLQCQMNGGRASRGKIEIRGLQERLSLRHRSTAC